MTVNVLYDKTAVNTTTYTYVYFCDVDDETVGNRSSTVINVLATPTGIPSVFLKMFTLALG